MELLVAAPIHIELNNLHVPGNEPCRITFHFNESDLLSMSCLRNVKKVTECLISFLRSILSVG